MDRSNPLERTNLSIRALEFLLDLQDFDASNEESIGTLCVLAEELQPGAVVGGTIIDGRSATFDRALFPSLPASFVSTLRHSPIAPPYIGTCAQAVCEGRLVVCPDVATDTRFDAGWLTRQQLEGAPTYARTETPAWGDRAYEKSIHDYYGAAPYWA